MISDLFFAHDYLPWTFCFVAFAVVVDCPMTGTNLWLQAIRRETLQDQHKRYEYLHSAPLQYIVLPSLFFNSTNLAISAEYSHRMLIAISIVYQSLDF